MLLRVLIRPLTIYCNNSATICFSQNNKNSACTKHFEVKYQFVREKIQELQTCIDHISNELMVADPLTKGLTTKVF